MNPVILTAFTFACLASTTLAIFDGGITLAAGGAALALGGGTTIGITTAGAIAGAAGLLGAGVVAGAIAGRLAGRGGRHFFKREAGDESEEGIKIGEKLAAIQLIDSYFMTILDVDVNDCGKKLVCEIKTIEASERSDEENLINELFSDDTATIDPLSAKAEYDLAAFIGRNYDKTVCARRYHRCELDRKVIVRGLEKLGQQQEEQ